jgi:hypothetical protein
MKRLSLNLASHRQRISYNATKKLHLPRLTYLALPAPKYLYRSGWVPLQIPKEPDYEFSHPGQKFEPELSTGMTRARVTITQQQQNRTSSSAMPTQTNGLFLGSSNISMKIVLEKA